jgi:hypothetical protein
VDGEEEGEEGAERYRRSGSQWSAACQTSGTSEADGRIIETMPNLLVGLNLRASGGNDTEAKSEVRKSTSGGWGRGLSNLDSAPCRRSSR